VSAETIRKGQDYEARCALWVEEQGWTILGRKVRHPSGIELGLRAVDVRCLPAAGLPYTTAKPMSELVVVFRKEHP
jgi:hypothetical protein